MKQDRKKIIKEKELICDGRVYRYRLIQTRSQKVASYLMPLYSIEVSLTHLGETTESSIDELFSDIGKALVFFDMLVDTLATPIDLPYIIEDRISM